MKFKSYASAKVIAIVMAVIISLGALFGQHNKIKQLEGELYKQQNIVDQRYNYTETKVDINSIQNEVNNLCEYKILDGTVNIKHTYVYQREGFLGMNHTKKLVGTADLYYELTTNLKDAKILKADNDDIVIQISKPQINKEACHRVANTFVRIDDECDQSLLSSKEDSEKATRHWEDTFDNKGVSMIKDAYADGYKEKDTMNATIEQIRLLFKELGYNQDIDVKIG